MCRGLLFVMSVLLASTGVTAEESDAQVVQLLLDKCKLTNVSTSDVAVLEEGRVVSLNFTNKNVSSDGITEIPAEIGKLTALQELHCSDNSITVIPPEIGNLVNLQKLDLSSNKIALFPAEIGNLVNLVDLDVRHNNIEMLPPEIAQLQALQILRLWGNKLTTLDAGITKLKELKELYLKDNRLTTLPMGITTMKFTYIDFIGNKMCNLNKRLDAWARKIDKKYKQTQRCVERN